MKTGILLSYKGIGANLMHLAYCHEIAKKYGPVSIITICPKLKEILQNDPLIEEIIYLNKYQKKLFDIFKLSTFLKSINLVNIFIFYPSIRYYLSSKLAGIKNIKHYLDIKNCPTETKIYLDNKNIEKYKKDNFKIITLGVGSSGPTTKWGYKNYILLIEKLNKLGNFYFYLLCGPEEKEIADRIISNFNNENFKSLSNVNISEAVYFIAASDLYIGNDSFGHHVSCQRGIPSFIIILDTPGAYTDYSKNQNKILPKNISPNKISHDSNFAPNSINIDVVIDNIKNFI